MPSVVSLVGVLTLAVVGLVVLPLFARPFRPLGAPGAPRVVEPTPGQERDETETEAVVLARAVIVPVGPDDDVAWAFGTARDLEAYGTTQVSIYPLNDYWVPWAAAACGGLSEDAEAQAMVVRRLSLDGGTSAAMRDARVARADGRRVLAFVGDDDGLLHTVVRPISPRGPAATAVSSFAAAVTCDIEVERMNDRVREGMRSGRSSRTYLDWFQGAPAVDREIASLRDAVLDDGIDDRECWRRLDVLQRSVAQLWGEAY